MPLPKPQLTEAGWIALAQIVAKDELREQMPLDPQLAVEENWASAGGEGLLRTLTNFLTLISIVFSMEGATAEPALRAIRQGANEKTPNAIPTPAELTVMELREVFRDGSDGGANIRAQLLREPASADFKAAMRKAGFNEYWADSIWAAHWSLPSPQQGFEMYHRLSRLPKEDPRYFGLEDLRTLLKQQDILADYRPRLEAIAFAPLTRVDVRRMYQLGVLSKPEVVEAYIQLGYDETNAKRLADFVEKDTEPDEKGVTLQALQQAVRAGIIDQGTFLNGLIELGFTPRAQGLLVALEQKRAEVEAAQAVELREKTLDRYRRRIRRDSRRGKLDTEQIVLDLHDELDLSEDDAGRFVAFNVLAPAPKEKDLTQSQILDAVKKGVLPMLEGRALLIRGGLDDFEADVLIASKLAPKGA